MWCKSRYRQIISVLDRWFDRTDARELMAWHAQPKLEAVSILQQVNPKRDMEDAPRTSDQNSS